MEIKKYLSKEAWVLVTDEPSRVSEAAKAGIPVIYHQKPGTPNVYVGDLTVLELSDVDEKLLEQVYKRHFGLPWTICETDRLLVRESILEDFEGLWELYRGKENRNFLPPLEDKETERKKLAAYIGKQYPFYGYGLYTVLEKESGRIVGRAGFENREWKGETYLEIGYLIREDCQRRGYATEVVEALGKCLRDYTGEAQVMIFCHRENRASVRVAEKMTEKYPDTFQICFFS